MVLMVIGVFVGCFVLIAVLARIGMYRLQQEEAEQVNEVKHYARKKKIKRHHRRRNSR